MNPSLYNVRTHVRDCFHKRWGRRTNESQRKPYPRRSDHHPNQTERNHYRVPGTQLHMDVASHPTEFVTFSIARKIHLEQRAAVMNRTSHHNSLLLPLLLPSVPASASASTWVSSHNTHNITFHKLSLHFTSLHITSRHAKSFAWPEKMPRIIMLSPLYAPALCDAHIHSYFMCANLEINRSGCQHPTWSATFIVAHKTDQHCTACLRYERTNCQKRKISSTETHPNCSNIFMDCLSL